MDMVSTVEYSILLHGRPLSPFRPSRGLRQGDPISPFLFILATEGLSMLIKREDERCPDLGLSASRMGPKITHLLFADDTFIFARASPQAAHAIS